MWFLYHASHANLLLYRLLYMLMLYDTLRKQIKALERGMIMGAFDKIIGYASMKEELRQISDMLKRREEYNKMGARLPRGIILFGEPGVGKTLMAECLIEDCGVRSFLLRRYKTGNDFLRTISDTFKQAKASAPSIVLLDDLDKFGSDESPDCFGEYSAVQAGIDSLKDTDVLVVATVNYIYNLPVSLTRPGRFDRKIKIKLPTTSDVELLLKHLIGGKKLSSNVNIDDITKAVAFDTCADLEMLLNEAAIYATYSGRAEIETSDLIQVIIRKEYDSCSCNFLRGQAVPRELALHEAGHAVACEILNPGSVGIISVLAAAQQQHGKRGFVRLCKEVEDYPDRVLHLLASKAAVEQYSEGEYARGGSTDLEEALSIMREAAFSRGAFGLDYVMTQDGFSRELSQNTLYRAEQLIYAELNGCMLKAKKIVTQNREFLERIADALMKKHVLLYSEIQDIRNDCCDLPFGV